jgi:hypothetical protein
MAAGIGIFGHFGGTATVTKKTTSTAGMTDI